MIQDSISQKYIESTIGIPIKILSNEFIEFHGNEHHKVVFQIKEESPDVFAFGALFTLSLMSFTYASPRGMSEMHFIPDEEWNIEYFLQGLEFEYGKLKFSGDYISGRHMKTTIIFEPGGMVTLATRNRGKGADRWMTHLQGRKHLQQI